MGTMEVNPGIAGEVQPSATCQPGTPAGRLYVPPAYTQTSQDREAQLTTANHKVAVGFTPEVDFALDSLSIYIKAVASAGNLSVALYSSGTAREPEGQRNHKQTKATPDMTANNAPSPCVVGIWDVNGANAELTGYEAYYAWDGGIRYSGTPARSNAAPTPSAPIYFTFDFGSGNAKQINRVRFTADTTTEGSPKAWTFWGSNGAAPAVNTDNDWTAIVSGIGGRTWTAEAPISLKQWTECDLFNTVAYRHYRITFTDRNGTGAYVALHDIQLIEVDNQEAPGTEIASLGTLAVSSAGWQRFTFSVRQLQRDTRYWLVFSGAESAGISLSTRRANPNHGSSIPYTCVCKGTTDGGANWTQQMQDGDLRPAMLNVVLQSTANHSPQLMYGRYNGAAISLHDGTSWQMETIPEAGITLNCEELAADTYHEVYLYEDGGTLALEASTAGWILQDGLEVQSGASGKRNVGCMTAITRQAGLQAPVKVEDQMYVWNRHNRLPTRIGRVTPYVGETIYTLSHTMMRGIGDPGGIIGWMPVHASDFRVGFVCGAMTQLVFRWTSFHINFGPSGIFSIAIDGVIPGWRNGPIHTTGMLIAQSIGFDGSANPGSHYLDLVYQGQDMAGQLYAYYRAADSQYYANATAMGSLDA
jgi:hypothetical protein